MIYIWLDICHGFQYMRNTLNEIMQGCCTVSGFYLGNEPFDHSSLTHVCVEPATQNSKSYEPRPINLKYEK